MSSQVIGGAPIQSYRQTLTASGNFTVPDGVTLINRRVAGGGGGGGGAGNSATAGGGGGTTTFGSLSATGGAGGAASALAGTSTTGAVGTAAAANTGHGGTAGSITMSSSDIPTVFGSPGATGQVLCDYLAVTPGASLAYTIGAGGTAGGATGSGAGGGTGGSGFIEVEWQV